MVYNFWYFFSSISHKVYGKCYVTFLSLDINNKKCYFIKSFKSKIYIYISNFINNYNNNNMELFILTNIKISISDKDK